MKFLFLKLGIYFLNFIWFFLEKLKVKKRVVIISRQSDKKSQDIELLEKMLTKKNIETKILCKKLEFNLISIIKYIFHMLVQMYYISTSKVVVLDGYCIVACLLKKKKGTVIIQMWHALGAFKKFGYSILDQKEGSSKQLARIMKMHYNYDYVFSSSEYSKKFFSEAFNVEIKKVIVMPLPRVDLLTNKSYVEECKNKIIKEYPTIFKKKIIVYVPTFRKNGENIEFINKLINDIDYKKYNLVIKLHPLSKIKIDDKRVIFDKKFSSIEMLAISEYVITDYSAIIYEAILLNKNIYYYCYDYDVYKFKRDFYLDYKKDLPGFFSSSSKKISNLIETGKYDEKMYKEFKKKYIEYEQNKSTTNISNFIISKLD